MLLSLVRSAPTSVGFLTCPHRAAVALSRARRALLIIGDLELLALHSQVWRGVRDILEDRGELVQQLVFTCQRHGTLTRVSREEDFRRRCSLPYSLPLPCRHAATPATRRYMQYLQLPASTPPRCNTCGTVFLPPCCNSCNAVSLPPCLPAAMPEAAIARRWTY